jgi:Cu(I)/Ag(I) efflux system membrane fusion protein
MKNRNKTPWIIAGSVLAGLFLGWLFFSSGNEAETHEHAVSEEVKNTIWTCSMHPQIRQPEPGDCPICGMDLIPVEKEKTPENPDAIQMTEYAMKLANVQTMEVGTETATNEIRLNGKIAVDERLAYSQSTHIRGRVEKLYVNFTGENVNRGQALARVYSPEMVTAQEELLQAYAIRESNPRLFEAAKQKLRNWKISEAQINRILERGSPSEQFTITADVSGIVTKKLVELGDYVERGMPIYEITDLSRVWALFDIYENQMGYIKEGSTVEFNVASIPGKTFKGKVDFIDPLINPQTRVSTARVVVENQNGLLKPGMLMTGILKNSRESGEKTDSNEITIPNSAVLWTGKRSVVYVKQSTGIFEMREVVLGTCLGNAYMVKEGLKAGEEVVVNGAFSVDAAAQLAGKPSMMKQYEATN